MDIVNTIFIECPICMESALPVSLISCGHPMCIDCCIKISGGGKTKCPFCRQISEEFTGPDVQTLVDIFIERDYHLIYKFMNTMNTRYCDYYNTFLSKLTLALEQQPSKIKLRMMFNLTLNYRQKLMLEIAHDLSTDEIRFKRYPQGYIYSDLVRCCHNTAIELGMIGAAQSEVNKKYNDIKVDIDPLNTMVTIYSHKIHKLIDITLLEYHILTYRKFNARVWHSLHRQCKIRVCEAILRLNYLKLTKMIKKDSASDLCDHLDKALKPHNIYVEISGFVCMIKRVGKIKYADAKKECERYHTSPLYYDIEDLIRYSIDKGYIEHKVDTDELIYIP